jgi:hypothetical protein
MSDLLSTPDIGIPAHLISRWIGSGMIHAPVEYRRGGDRYHGTKWWNPSEIRLLQVLHVIDALRGPTKSRSTILGIDWTALGDLIRSHSEAGWLVIRDDGRLSFTESAGQAVEWQCSALLAVCVRVEAAA